MIKERLLVVGNGMASVRFVEELLAACPERYSIIIVGAEARVAYNRVLLSALLAGDVDHVGIELKPAAWYARHGVTLITGRTVAAIDCAARVATLDDGAALGFDALVFATGSSPIRLPQPGMDLPGVMAFRDLEDVAVMQAAAGKRATVIGGGLLGIEAAYGLVRAGAKVTLVHIMDRLMERQLDPAGARLVKAALEKKGVEVLLGAQTAAVRGDGRVARIAFADGGERETDLVVVAIGVRANAALAKAAGVATARGILVDDQMRTDVAGVYAIGECAEHRGTVYGLVEPAYAQASALAAHLAGVTDAAYAGTVLATNLKVSGVPVFSAGDFAGEQAETLVLEDRAGGLYRKLCIRDDRLVGCVLVGEADDASFYRDLIRSGASVARLRPSLLHGPDFTLPDRAAEAA